MLCDLVIDAMISEYQRFKLQIFTSSEGPDMNVADIPLIAYVNKNRNYVLM